MKKSGKPGSSSQQSTLFQTWGTREKKPHSDKNKKTKLKSIKNLQQRIKPKIGLLKNDNNSGNLWSGLQKEKTTVQEEIINVPDDFNEIMNGLDEHDDMGLIDEYAEQQRTYLESIFNANSQENIPGFDEAAGHNYIYPINYPIREYQFNIIMKALVKNTLVVLPTGLGKTFIAAVVMYNFYRWYPLGKVLFMAPTKPLVAQQIQACYSITGTPLEDTVEMTGM